MDGSDRIRDLETALSFQERRVELLDDMVQALGRNLDQLRLRVEALEARRAPAEGAPGETEPPPPHY